MCEECRQTPCHPRCPNADEPRVVTVCDVCDSKIYEGDTMYKIEGMCICEDCISKGETCAEMDDI